MRLALPFLLAAAMRLALPFLLAGPVAAAHDGVVAVRTGPEPSDIALFVVTALAVWFVRRSLRSRFAKPPAKD